MLTLVIALICAPLIGVAAIELEDRLRCRRRMHHHAMKVMRS